MEQKYVKLTYSTYSKAHYACEHGLFINQVVKGGDGELYQVTSINRNIKQDDDGCHLGIFVIPVMQVQITKR